jgi:hypothetical protein
MNCNNTYSMKTIISLSNNTRNTHTDLTQIYKIHNWKNIKKTMVFDKKIYIYTSEN